MKHKKWLFANISLLMLSLILVACSNAYDTDNEESEDTIETENEQEIESVDEDKEQNEKDNDTNDKLIEKGEKIIDTFFASLSNEDIESIEEIFDNETMIENYQRSFENIDFNYEIESKQLLGDEEKLTHWEVVTMTYEENDQGEENAISKEVYHISVGEEIIEYLEVVRVDHFRE